VKKDSMLLKTEDIQKMQELRETENAKRTELTPCNIGFMYMRMYVNGEFSSCCISPSSLGAGKKFSDWRDAWFSSELDAFRAKTSRLHLERFHQTDPNWIFCNQCGHSTLNQKWEEQSKNVISPLDW
jgi:hypothetical protein